MKALEDVRVRARALQLSLSTDRLQQVWSELRDGGEAAPASATVDDAPHDVAGEGKDGAGAMGGSKVVSLAAIAHRLFAAAAGGGGDGPGSQGSCVQDAGEAGNEPRPQRLAAMEGGGVSGVGAAELYAAYCAIVGQAGLGLFRALNCGDVVLLPGDAKAPIMHDDGRSSLAAAGRSEAGIERFARMLRSRLTLQESDPTGAGAANHGRVNQVSHGAAARGLASHGSADIPGLAGGAGAGAGAATSPDSDSEEDAFGEYWALLEGVAVGSSSPSVLPPGLLRVVGVCLCLPAFVAVFLSVWPCPFAPGGLRAEDLLASLPLVHVRGFRV